MMGEKKGKQVADLKECACISRLRRKDDEPFEINMWNHQMNIIYRTITRTDAIVEAQFLPGFLALASCISVCP
ncbi:hypothetical protein LOK49_LG15G01666 [Camellia lanceoleosa]|uniref:Uncharacterized protein n=1 Tax=Camellia lanceoleosa TaxID=1840588 RepID=A0ACC0F309_9ERIC|nr:hypothetical protein LOK49_LG15G01666 [Camellia lanceoleosa]